MMIINTVINTY